MSCWAICRRACWADAWRIDAEAANRAIDNKVARPLGLHPRGSARGMLAILDKT